MLPFASHLLASILVAQGSPPNPLSVNVQPTQACMEVMQGPRYQGDPSDTKLAHSYLKTCAQAIKDMGRVKVSNEFERSFVLGCLHDRQAYIWEMTALHTPRKALEEAFASQAEFKQAQIASTDRDYLAAIATNLNFVGQQITTLKAEVKAHPH
jgi:hypothetical protein